MNHVPTRKNKISGICLAALFSCLFGCMLAGASLGYAAETIGKDKATLFLPSSYEEYLELNSPVDAAFSDNYIAIADGKALYLYSRAEGKYTKTTIPEENESSAITKIGFANERLFLSVRGASNSFYEFDFDKKQLKKFSSINCSTFCIGENTLYTANVGGERTTLASYSISELKQDTEAKANDLGTLEKRTTPSMTLLDGTLYCTIDEHVYYVNLSSSETFNDNRSYYLSSITSDNQNVKSTCAHDNQFYYTAAGGLYRASFSETDQSSGKAVRVLEGKSFGALTSYKGDLYCICDKSVRRLAFPTEDKAAFTDYEICAASDSKSRLNGAADIARAGNLLVTANKTANRVLIHDLANGTSSVIECTDDGTPFAPNLVATDGSIIAVANDHTVFVYKHPHPYSTEYVCAGKHTENNYNISGVACVYGICYFVTDGKGYGRMEIGEASTQPSETPSFTVKETSVVRNSISAPKALTADVYGTLYAMLDNGNVLAFTEEEFVTQGMQGTQLEDVTVPIDATSLRADFEGNLYYLKKGAMYRSGETDPFPQINVPDFIYSEKEKTPVAFALGYEDDEVYFLYDSGDFIIKTNAGTLGFPAFGRLSKATDIARAGDLLVTADTGNNHITVYNLKKHSFASIQTDFSPSLVATDGSVIAAASGNKVYVCKDPSGNSGFDESVTADIGTIKGLACVHENVYYITEYGYGKVEEEDFGLVSRLEPPLIALTSDDNGILYVVDSSGYVRYYHENEFIDTSVVSGGDLGISLHLPISSLRADREGSLYYLSENTLWKNGEKLSELKNRPSIYGDESSPVAFALDSESDDVFILYDNHIVKIKSEALGISSRSYNKILGIRQDVLLPDSRRKRSEHAPTVGGI